MTAPCFEFADATGAQPFSVDLLGTESGGVLVVAMAVEDLARAIEVAAFHLRAGVVGELGVELAVELGRAPDRPNGSTARVRLRGARGQRPSDGLDDQATAEWLAAQTVGADAADWLITDWWVDGIRHRTAWDYVADDSATQADPMIGALQFVLDAHPDLPGELADAGRLLETLTPTGDSMLDEVAGVLAGLGVRSDLLHGKGPLGFTMQSDPVDDEPGGSWNCLADELPDSWLVIYAELPVAVPEADRAAALPLVARINGELQIGALLIDQTGETVMYRAATCLGGIPGRSAAIGQLLDVVLTDTQTCLAHWRWAWAPADES